MEVEVLASGRCLLGHPVTDAPTGDEPASERPADSSPPSFPAPRDLKPRRRARKMPEPEPPADLPRSIRTAPTPEKAPERAPERTLRSVPPPPADDEPSAPAASAASPVEAEDTVVPRISRPWAPVEPDGPSGPVGDPEPWLRSLDPPLPPVPEKAEAPSPKPPAAFEPPRPKAEPERPRSKPERAAPSPEPDQPTATRPSDVEAALRDVLAERDRAEAVPPEEAAPRLPKDLNRPAQDDTGDKPKGRRLRLPFAGRTRTPAAPKKEQPAEPARTLKSVPPPPAEPKSEPKTGPAAKEDKPEQKRPSASASLDAMLAGRRESAAAEPEPKAEAKPEPKVESKPKLEAKPAPKVESKPEPEPAPEPAAAEPPRRLREKPSAPPIPAEPAASVAAAPEVARVPGIAPGTRNPPATPVGRRITAPTPRNTVAWGLAIAATFIAGVAALVLTPSRADDGRPVVRTITLGEVPGHTVQHDPETESRLRAELGAQRAVPRQLSASTIRNADGDIVALYQAIVFNDKVAETQRDTDDFIALFAEGAGVSADSFAERPLGDRMIWSGLLDQGQAILLFRGPEVVIVITAETGAEGDKLADAILGARGI